MALYFGIIVVVALLIIISFVCLFKAVTDVPEGYEDDLGFHYGWKEDEDQH